jgi:hypothetical protein
VTDSFQVDIRPECLRAADEWERPRTAEIQEIVRRTGLSARGVARVLGLSEHGGRVVVRSWIGQADIPYAAWALLCDMAGYERIWLNSTRPHEPEAVGD